MEISANSTTILTPPLLTLTLALTLQHDTDADQSQYFTAEQCAQILQY